MNHKEIWFLFQIWQPCQWGLKYIDCISLTIKLECSGYDSDYTASDGEVPVLELWREWNTLLLPVPFWSGMVESVKIPSMSQIDVWKLSDRNMWYHITKLFVLKIIAWIYNY